MVTMANRKINATKNYRLFKRSEDNRPTNVRKRKWLRNSMEKYGFIPCFPIICVRDKDGGLIVKDGQHRLELAETLGLTVYWVETDIDFDVPEVAKGVEKWDVRSYAQTYAQKGLSEYQEILDFSARHDLPVGVSVALLGGTISFGNVSDAYYDGSYKIVDRIFADRVAATYGPLVRLNSSVRNARLLLACMAACRIDNFDTDRLIKNAKRCPEKILNYATKDAYLAMLEDVYNYQCRNLLGLKAMATQAMRERSPIGRSERAAQKMSKERNPASKDEKTETKSDLLR